MESLHFVIDRSFARVVGQILAHDNDYLSIEWLWYSHRLTRTIEYWTGDWLEELRNIANVAKNEFAKHLSYFLSALFSNHDEAISLESRKKDWVL